MPNLRGAITPHRMRDGHLALLYYNNGHTDKVGYVGRLVVWITVGKLNNENLIRYESDSFLRNDEEELNL